MNYENSIEIDANLFNEIRSLAALKNIDIDDYVTLLLEEEILKEITVSLVSDYPID
ncbi:Hypothetical protein NATL1_08811 [Prochlorococcus marinus str. NATL1A]|uniref:Uncharacterized protein n=1 Tax=Prochlorococcus marinus (strain NATL1A) TaxID=167555 RepID=A2C1S9_PROM1|nr:hypothetical protein [Prochlorococcus marinus]ABM75439.1 Hypothetical protein NATL1_08811 [Prochlorococcus marinus str. NATL1A]